MSCHTKSCHLWWFVDVPFGEADSWCFHHGKAGCGSEAHTRDAAVSPSGHAKNRFETGYHTAMTICMVRSYLANGNRCFW